jgi:hypothetical protein
VAIPEDEEHTGKKETWSILQLMQGT